MLINYVLLKSNKGNTCISKQSTIRTPLYLLLNTYDFEKVTKVTQKTIKNEELIIRNSLFYRPLSTVHCQLSTD